MHEHDNWSLHKKKVWKDGKWVEEEWNEHEMKLKELMINVEGCVNTLQEECSNFYETHGNDGRNHSAPSRYPCFYSPNNPEFVVARYNLNQSRWIFLMFFIIPASLFILSCGVLFTCSRCLNVDNSGHMEMNCCHTDNKELSSSSQFKLDKDADAL